MGFFHKKVVERRVIEEPPVVLAEPATPYRPPVVMEIVSRVKGPHRHSRAAFDDRTNE